MKGNLLRQNIQLWVFGVSLSGIAAVLDVMMFPSYDYGPFLAVVFIIIISLAFIDLRTDVSLPFVE